MKGNRKWTSFLLVMLAAAFLFISPRTVQAASFKNSRPKITKGQYRYDKVSLTWTKVAGAKTYEIERRLMNPKTGKYGKYKMWAKTTKPSVARKASGDYQYRVRAVRGKARSKWSAPKRVFAAYAKIVDRTYEAGGFLTIKIQVTNKTKSPMGLMKGYVDESRKSDILFYDKKGKKVDSYKGDLYSGSIWSDDRYVTDEIPAMKTKVIYLRTSINSTTWWNYPIFGGPTDLEHHIMKIVTKFYPNPNKENTTMRITYIKNVKKSVTG